MSDARQDEPRGPEDFASVLTAISKKAITVRPDVTLRLAGGHTVSGRVDGVKNGYVAVLHSRGSGRGRTKWMVAIAEIVAMGTPE